MTARVQQFALKHGLNHLSMPVGYHQFGYRPAEVLSVAFDHNRDELSLWALCSSEPLRQQHRRFLVLDTDELTSDAIATGPSFKGACFIGTAVSRLMTFMSMSGGGTHADVRHVFELFGEET